MANTGLSTQSDDSVLLDLEEFYFGSLSWYHGSERDTHDPSRTNVTLDDPDEDEGVTKVYPLTADQIREAFKTAKDKGYHLCYAEDITTEQLGYGCAQDLDIIVQTACYGELVFG